MVETPVCGDGGDVRVVVVVGVVCCSNEVFGDGRTKQNAGNVVALCGVLAIGLPGDVDEGFFVEVGIV